MSIGNELYRKDLFVSEEDVTMQASGELDDKEAECHYIYSICFTCDVNMGAKRASREV